MRRLILFLLTAVAAFPQVFSVGVKGGAPLTDAFQTGSSGPLSYFSTTRRYTVGPMAEVRLPFQLGVEFDALYTRLDYDRSTNLVDALQHAATTSDSWEFPLLLKRRLSRGPIQPYLAGGVSFNRLSGVTEALSTTFFPSRVVTSSGTPRELRNDLRTGIVLGGGVDVKALFLHISPEVRYTRWGQDTFLDPTSGGNLLRSGRNQAEFMLGITF